MNKTKIEWCESTWNPVTGCLHGCEYCYARKIAARFGKEQEFSHCFEVDDNLYWLDRKQDNPYPFIFKPTFHAYKLNEPIKMKKPRTIFVCSMADLFGDWIPDEWIEAVFRACEKAPQHRYLFLTKNPKRLCELADSEKLPEGKNYWWGSTITSKRSLFYPGRILDNTFLSIEPILEPLDAGLGSFGGARWIIIGAETGNRKNKVVPQKEWIDNICETAAITRTPVFMKDSLIPIVGEENMRREFPWKARD